MLTLRVTSVNGQAPARPIEATFDAAGGTIGRADDNRLVLPDSQRLISRVHARVVPKAGGFELVDQGGNPIDVNGTALGRGEAVALRAGDQLRIGGYAISVSTSRPAGDRLAHAPVVSAAPIADPLAAFGSPSAADPLGLGFGAAGAPQAPPTARSARTVPAGAIPDDFDPFADPFAVRPAPPGPTEPLPDEFHLGLGASTESVDALFDLPPVSGTDPFAGGALSAGAGPRGAPPPSLDPMEPWQGRRAPAAAPVPDRVPEIHGSFKPPMARSRPAPEPTLVPPASPPAPPPQGNVFLSWEDESGGSPAASPAPSPAPEIRPDDLLEILGGARPEPEQASAPPPAPAVRQQVESRSAPDGAAVARDALTEAFLTGLGASRLPLQEMTPEMMERIGQLLREATQGTLDLLRARAMTKREVRAEATMIVGEDNNPLKFSPDVAVALAHLISPQGSGFLPPVEAMRDAYDDLRSHQFGFMAGVRAALAGVLKRFDPAVLEQRLLNKSLLDSVLPINRRAKLWDLYEQLYRDIAGEAEEDFHTLFGKAFLRAYEEQVARLDERGNPR